MTLERKTLLDQVEIRRDGTLQVRLVRAIVDGETIVVRDFHRTVVEPGIDTEAQLAMLNMALLNAPEEEGGPYAAVESAEWDCVRRTAASEHTPEVIVDYHEKAALARAKASGLDLGDLEVRETVLQEAREWAAALVARRNK